jgi:hypothetical protein
MPDARFQDFRPLCFWVVIALLAAGARAQDEPPVRQATVAPMLLTPKDRVLLVRGFVPGERALRLYACVVGTPAGVHYAYDFETGALLSVWRGPFADVAEINGPRPRSETARPAGPEIALTAKPLLAQFPNRMMIAYPKTWPVQPAPLYKSEGYDLERDGQPVFLARLEDLVIRDRIAPSAGGRGLERRLEFSGQLSPWETWLLLAEADKIGPVAGGWTDGRWTIAWPADSVHKPTTRREGSRQQLVLRLEPGKLGEPVIYTIQW